MAGEIRFKIKGKAYDTATVDEVSLLDIMRFNKQAQEIGLDVTWNDVERISTETAEAIESARAAGIADEDIDPHPQAMIMFGVTVWAARRVAGEDVTLGEALDVKVKDIEVIEGRKAPKDHQPKKKSRSTRLASAPATSGPSVSSESSESTTPQTSSAASESA